MHIYTHACKLRGAFALPPPPTLIDVYVPSCERLLGGVVGVKGHGRNDLETTFKVVLRNEGWIESFQGCFLVKRRHLIVRLVK